jgi:hypothetical protein
MITQNYLKSILDYNPETGIFVWKVKFSKKINIGDVAGTKDSKGYIAIKVNKKTYASHRIAWLYIYGYIPEKQIDHINGNRVDNRICNLREATNQENQFNRQIQKNNTSGVKGVCWSNQQNKWVARIRANGKRITLGLFDNLELAELVINEARLKYHKQFANHGKGEN